MKTAYLSLGSNLGDRERHLMDALARLEDVDLHVVRRSSLFETEPRDVANQPWFLNMAVEVQTTLFPLQLLARILKVERAMGRTRTVPKGPRVIDIDILLYGSAVVSTRALTIPHASLPQRRFVLEPLVELAPELRHPVSRQTMRELLGAVSGQIVKKFRSV